MLRKISPAIRQVVKCFPVVFPHGMADVKLCMDRAPWHQQAVRKGLLADMGLTERQVLPHPPSSPDFQAPVEWVHSWLNKATRKLLEQRPKITSDTGIKAVIKKLFDGRLEVRGQKVVTPANVAAAFKRLERNYTVIVEAKGDYGNNRDT